MAVAACHPCCSFARVYSCHNFCHSIPLFILVVFPENSNVLREAISADSAVSHALLKVTFDPASNSLLIASHLSPLSNLSQRASSKLASKSQLADSCFKATTKSLTDSPSCWFLL